MAQRQKTAATPKVVAWPNSTFALKMDWKDTGDARHLLVHLERRAPGRFGRLRAMHAIVPKGRKRPGNDAIFHSARYRAANLRGACEVFLAAGATRSQAEEFLQAIHQQYPCPTVEESFLEQIRQPLLAMALGSRHQELSYFRTGVPELTEEDTALIKESFEQMSENAEQRKNVLKVALGKANG